MGGHPLAAAIMTSPSNHDATVSFLEKNDLFGFPADQLFIFQQQELPFLDDEGNWFLQAPGKLATGPDGNGDCLKAFYQSGIWQKWKSQGIECVNTVLIDNPLADPFDIKLCNAHLNQKTDVTMKCIERISPDEKVGVVIKQDGKVKVVEYTEISQAPISAYPLANISLFCFGMSFIEKASSQQLSWHLQRKKTKDGKDIWKFETFIFDLLEDAKRVKVLVSTRRGIRSFKKCEWKR